MTTKEPRLHRRIRRDFPEPGSATEIIRLLAEADLPHLNAEALERVHAAVVLLAGGNFARFRHFLAEATIDWRDVLVTAELANKDWPTRLDEELGFAPPDPPNRNRK